MAEKRNEYDLGSADVVLGHVPPPTDDDKARAREWLSRLARKQCPDEAEAERRAAYWRDVLGLVDVEAERAEEAA